MIGPFIVLYAQSQLGVSLSEVLLLLTVPPAVAIVVAPVGGLIVDRFGTRVAVVAALGTASAVFALAVGSQTFIKWIILLALLGAGGPLFRLGVNVVVAQTPDPKIRLDAYALVRRAYNLGVCVGPALGGVLVSVSYALAFRSASITLAVLGVAMAILLPRVTAAGAHSKPCASSRGYGEVVRDRFLLAICAAYGLICIAYTMLFSLLPLYMKNDFDITVRQVGLVVATNAVLVVIFQSAVTRAASLRGPISPLVLGSCVSALGFVAISQAASVGWFVTGMAVLTFGEMLVLPTVTTMIAGRAPAGMQGRYMSVQASMELAGSFLAPLIASLLSGWLGAASCWAFTTILCLLAASGFAFLHRRTLLCPPLMS